MFNFLKKQGEWEQEEWEQDFLLQSLAGAAAQKKEEEI